MLSGHELVCIAKEAICDPRTVRRYLDGESVAGNTAIRIETAARALGITLPDAKKRGRG